MPLFNTEGIILRKYDCGENDEIVSLMSCDCGKIKVLVRGVRAIKGSRVGKFELFSHVRVLLSPGRGLSICSQVEAVDAHPRLRSDLLKSAYGLYVLEIFDSMIPFREPEPHLFRLLRVVLSFIEAHLCYERSIVFLLYQLLRLLGYGPSLRQCVICGKEVEGVRFSASSGGVLCIHCAHNGAPSLRISREVASILRLLPALTLKALPDCKIEEMGARKVRELFEYYIEYHFSHRINCSRYLGAVKSITI
ncbi:MAG: DNA repair protein RecO [Vulcanimicrobiota bacterium]